MAMMVGAMASAAGSYYGAKEQSNTQKDISRAQLAQQNRALDFTKSVYGDTKTNLGDFLSLGQGASGKLSSAFSGDAGSSKAFWDSALANSPFFAGLQGNVMDATKASSSKMFGQGGNMFDALYDANYASHKQVQDDYIKNLMGLTNIGLTAGTSIANSGTGAATNFTSAINAGNQAMGTTLNSAAQAQGAGLLGVGNAISSYGTNSAILNGINRSSSGSNPFNWSNISLQ
jgi:hypothetical protein